MSTQDPIIPDEVFFPRAPMAASFKGSQRAPETEMQLYVQMPPQQVRSAVAIVVRRGKAEPNAVPNRLVGTDGRRENFASL